MRPTSMTATQIEFTDNPVAGRPAAHTDWCTDHLGDICRSDHIVTGPVEVQAVSANNWDPSIWSVEGDALTVEVDTGLPLTPEDARLLAVRLVRLADAIDRENNR